LHTQYESGFLGPKRHPLVVLAARATEIYFYRLLRDRSRSRVGDAEVSALVDKMMLLAKRDDMRPYTNFFREMDGILSPMFELRQFKLALIQTLAPGAQPLLEKLVTGITTPTIL
jgi:hypothetical protein